MGGDWLTSLSESWKMLRLIFAGDHQKIPGKSNMEKGKSKPEQLLLRVSCQRGKNMVCHQESNSTWTSRWFYVKEDTGGLQRVNSSSSLCWNIWYLYIMKVLSGSTPFLIVWILDMKSSISLVPTLSPLALPGQPTELYWWLKCSRKLLRGLRENFKRSWPRELFRRLWKEMMHWLSFIIIEREKNTLELIGDKVLNIENRIEHQARLNYGGSADYSEMTDLFIPWEFIFSGYHNKFKGRCKSVCVCLTREEMPLPSSRE